MVPLWQNTEKLDSIYSPPYNFCHFQVLLILTKTPETLKKCDHILMKSQSSICSQNEQHFPNQCQDTSPQWTDGYTLQLFPAQQPI